MTPIIAYLDPGSGSLILQALVGGFSGIVVLGRYVWTQFQVRKTVQTATQLSSAEMPVRLS
jgi:hypothetical protein